MFKRIPGTKDILPEETPRWQRMEEVARSCFALYNFKEIRPPLIEEESLFNRSLGESAEIVQKQMFLIKNKADLYCLRPEATASVVRAYIENNLDKTSGFIKLYYMGPMFRLERPQKGRLRQFHHIGAEVIGSQEPQIDVEVISLADLLLKNFSVKGYKIRINSLGCEKDRQALSVYLKKSLKDKLGDLCEDCKVRFNINILRILDCKNEACKGIVKNLDLKNAYLCQECGDHFAAVKQGLDSLSVDYETLPTLVRGLDYYTRTVFEIPHSDLGAQDALCAGGRYDNLVKELGGPELGAMGFAFGVERLLLVSTVDQKEAASCLTYLISLGEKARQEGMKLLDTLRKIGIACDTDYENKSLKGAMRKANDLKAKFVLLLGENEINKGTVTLKDMISGTQEEINLPEIAANLKKRI